MDEDFAIRGERKSNPERLLQSDHVLVQIHPERRILARHCTNPAPPGSKTDLSSTGSPPGKTPTSAPERRGEGPIDSSAARELQRGHAGSCFCGIRRRERERRQLRAAQPPFLRTEIGFIGMGGMWSRRDRS